MIADAATGELLPTLQNHDHSVHTVASTPDSKKMITAWLGQCGPVVDPFGGVVEGVLPLLSVVGRSEIRANLIAPYEYKRFMKPDQHFAKLALMWA